MILEYQLYFIAIKCLCLKEDETNPKNILCGIVVKDEIVHSDEHPILEHRCKTSLRQDDLCTVATNVSDAVDEEHKFQLCTPKGRF